VCGVLGDAECKAAVAAAELENAAVAEVGESTQRRDVGAFRIEQLRQRRLLMWVDDLYALRVVPRAPNLIALRRVSSNFERA
jgi:hypothetical protein